jgi:core-2/I-Branching enzyme
MKIAHLIIAHKNPAQLERLLQALDHPDFDFYIHLDKKTNAAPFLHLTERKNVFMIANRASVFWAGFGSAQATINGFREILPTNKYDYINVTSGQDFPLKSAANILRYIRERQGREFIDTAPIEDSGTDAGTTRYRKYHLINWQIPGRYQLERWVNRLLPPRKFPLDHTIVGRSNWFTLTPAAAQYLLDFLDRHPEVVRYYKYCWGVDEFIFATTLYNSPFRERIADNLVYVDWTGQTKGHPRILLAGDFPALQATEKLFARKFDMDVDPAVFALLEEWITSPDL